MALDVSSEAAAQSLKCPGGGSGDQRSILCHARTSTYCLNQAHANHSSLSCKSAGLKGSWNEQNCVLEQQKTSVDPRKDFGGKNLRLFSSWPVQSALQPAEASSLPQRCRSQKIKVSAHHLIQLFELYLQSIFNCTSAGSDRGDNILKGKELLKDHGQQERDCSLWNRDLFCIERSVAANPALHNLRVGSTLNCLTKRYFSA